MPAKGSRAVSKEARKEAAMARAVSNGSDAHSRTTKIRAVFVRDPQYGKCREVYKGGGSTCGSR